MTKGMNAHHSAAARNDEWLTPPTIIQALGKFDLDPCAPSDERRPWDTAAHHYSVEQDGLQQDWFGRVWMNPPYGRATGKWLTKLADYGNGIALIFARTDTEMFFSQVWARATAVLFLRGRLHFHYVDGRKATANAGAPSCLVAYGTRNAASLRTSGIPGKLIWLQAVGDVCWQDYETITPGKTFALYPRGAR